LTPFTSKTDNFSTVSNAISTELANKGQNKKELVVDSPSTDEIASESSETTTDYSRKLEASNSNTHSLGKRFATTAPPFTISFSDQRKRKIFIKPNHRKNFPKINSNSSAEKYSMETEYTRSISMENQQTDQPAQPFTFNMELTTGANPAEFMRTINARFVSMAKAINGLQVQNKGFEQFMDAFNQVKAELIEVKDKLAEVTAERDALKHKYMGSAASIHANNTDSVGNKDNDHSNKDQEHDKQVNDQQQDFPALNESQGTLAQRAAMVADKPVQQRRKRVTQGQRKAAARVFMEPSGESGFTSVYLPCRRRMPISELRGNLRKLKIANFRVLDVSYPAQKVVALLVHQEYAKELLERFETAGVKSIENFDPLDGKVISDPKWVDKTEAERADQAHTIHRVRCLVALDHIRIPVKYSVARHFVRLGWVEGETLQRMQTGDQLAPPREQGDLEMKDSSATAAAAFRAASEPPQVGAGTSSNFSSLTRASSLPPTDGNSGRNNE
jgi:hypothetical protein